jgi:nucleoside phosphorylase
MSKVVIVAAMERELAPLVRGWKRATLDSGDKKLTLFESDGMLAVIAGIGCRNAELAARSVMAQYRPTLVISA